MAINYQLRDIAIGIGFILQATHIEDVGGKVDIHNPSSSRKKIATCPIQEPGQKQRAGFEFWCQILGPYLPREQGSIVRGLL